MISRWLPKSIDYQELVILTRQLAALMQSGSGIARSLQTIGQQARDLGLKAAFEDVLRRVSSGERLSMAASRWPRVFNGFYVAMLKTGETTGQLDEALERLSRTLEKNLAIRHRVKAALMYPAFIFGLTAVLTGVVFYTVIPGFVEIFKSSGVQLPWPTRLLIFVSDSLLSPACWCLMAALALEGMWLFRSFRNNPQLQYKFWDLALALPVLGSLLRNSATCNLCASMETLISCGMTLDRSLLVAGEATGNPVYKKTLELAVEQLQHGQPLSKHMQMHDDIYPIMLIQMIRTGEEASSLDVMFARVGTTIETDLDNQILALSASLEPLMLMFVAGIVAFIVLSIFLPLYGTLNQIGV